MRIAGFSSHAFGRFIVAIVIATTAALAADTANASTFQTLYRFCHKQACNDGGVPDFSPLSTDGQGHFFGLGAIGGSHAGGVVYEWSGNNYNKIASLPHSEIDGSQEPSFASGKLVVDVDGNLYGVTSIGGSSHLGSVFELIRNANDGKLGLKTLYEFCPGGTSVQQCPDGAEPQMLTYIGAQEGKLYDGKSPLYGVAKYGGEGFDGQTHGLGVVFSLTKTGTKWSQNVIYNFCTQHSQTAACTDGAFPQYGLIAKKNGRLFAVTGEGGSGVSQVGYGGAVVSLSPVGSGVWSLSVLYNFCATQACFDGKEPSGLAMDKNGDLFGVTTYGGTAGPSGEGVIYKLSANKSYAYTQLYSFCSNTCDEGGEPLADLAIDPSGTLYGTTSLNKPSLFALTPHGTKSTLTVLHQFCLQTSCTDGTNPNSAVVPDGAGHYLGTTSYKGNAQQAGTLFELTP